MITAYLRVSTDKQKLEHQELCIKEYCERNNIVIDQWIGEKISGRKKFIHRKIWGVIENLNKGDVIIVAEMSRIGRNMFDSIRLLMECMDAGASFISVRDNYVLTDDAFIKLHGILMCFYAELEVLNIRVRTKEALAVKKSNGIIGGRRRGDVNKSHLLNDKKDEINSLLIGGLSLNSISKQLNINYSTLNKYVKREGIRN